MELTQDTSPMRARNAAVSTLKAGGKKHRLLTRDQLDGRTNAAKVFDRLVTNIEADLGGRDQLSTIELALIEAFLWRCCHAREPASSPMLAIFGADPTKCSVSAFTCRKMSSAV
jgi:hypothetical protein